MTPPQGVRHNHPLTRLSTVRTGGPAEHFAHAGDEQQLQRLLSWASEEQLPVAVVGSGSNLLIADAGVPGLVVKLDRDLAEVFLDEEGPRMVCGGAARLPSVAASAARAGLSGIEFGVNIPGTVGGAVRMNANAYGGELARVLEWAQIVTAQGSERRGPDQLGFAYRQSGLRAGEVVARVSFVLEPAKPAQVKARMQDMRRCRQEAQPQGIKTFGSTFKNPEDPRAEGATAGMLLERAGCKGLAVGGARFAPKHANFVENTGTATTADIVELMAAGRERVLERFGVALEPEVQTLGSLRFPWE